jgi:hypothetical protein
LQTRTIFLSQSPLTPLESKNCRNLNSEYIGNARNPNILVRISNCQLAYWKFIG